MKWWIASCLVAIASAAYYTATSPYVIVRLFPYECFGTGYTVMPISSHRIWWRGEGESHVQSIRWIYRTPDGRVCVGTVRP